MSTNKIGKASDSTAEDHLFDIFLSALAATFPAQMGQQRDLWVRDEPVAELAAARIQLAEAIAQRNELQCRLDKAVADNNAYKGVRLSFGDGSIVLSSAWMGELVELRQEVDRLTTELKTTRAQRDATQRALHKANHANDELRRQVAAPKAAVRKRPNEAEVDGR